MVSDSTIIGAGDYITSTTEDYRSACAVELCGCLAALQSIDYFLSELDESSKIDTRTATDCLGVMHRLDKQVTVISMKTKLHLIVRVFFCLSPRD